MLQQTSLKRRRDVDDYYNLDNRSKIANSCSSAAYNFTCPGFYRGEILEFQLSQVFREFKYTVLFFCSYDLYGRFINLTNNSDIVFADSFTYSTQQSREDLLHIQKTYFDFVKYSALPVALTQDRVQIHKAYATPGVSPGSLAFEPLYIMASDNTDRLISRFYKNLISYDTQRAVVIINHQLQIVFAQAVSDLSKLPMDVILNFFT